MSQLFQELRRRNVFRVAIAYLAVAWLILQLVDIVLDNMSEPEWVMQVLMVFLAIGFPLSVFFAWAFEMTPEGIKREQEVDRSQSITSQTGSKLDRMIIVVLAAAVIFLLYDRFTAPASAPEVAMTDKSVAVLPFVAMSNGPDDEYFADGLTEEILNSLTQIPDLLVTARTSAFHFKGQDIPVPEIAKTLGVAHVIEGSVRRDGDRLRVTAQLIRAEDGFHLWSERYDHKSEDAFAVQTDIAEKIAGVLNVVLDETLLAQMRAVGLRNPEAYIALQKGLELYADAHSELGRTDFLLEANVWFERALELAPNLSDAHLLHSDYFAHTLINASAGADISEHELSQAIVQMRTDLDLAVAAAPDKASQMTAAFVKGLLTGEWRALPTLMDELFVLGGCNDPAWLDQVTLAYGLAAEHLKVEERLIECDPLNYSAWLGAGRSYLWLGDPEAAIEIYARGIDKVSNGTVNFYYAMSFLAAGRFDDTQKTIDSVLRSDDNILRMRLKLAAAKGDAALTEQVLAEYLAAEIPHDEQLTVMYAISNNRNRANQLAAEIDARPFGHLLLMQVLPDCMCGAPFDIEHTPNFAKLLEDANLSWPPASPIEWPLKTW